MSKIRILRGTSATQCMIWSLYDQAAQDPIEFHHYHTGRYCPNRDDIDTFNNDFFIAIDEKDNPVGFVKISKFHVHRNISISGFYVKPDKRGGATALLLIKKVYDHFMTELATFHRIACTVYATNTRAVKLYEKFFHKEGVLKGEYCVNGKYVDSIVFGITREDDQHLRAFGLYLDALLMRINKNERTI